MWQQLVTCASEREVAFCIPLPESIGGPAFPIFWYGILAALGILVGASYARWHVEREGEDPDIIWDLMLWVLPAGLLGGRLWYVAQAVFIDGSSAYSLQRPIEIIWPRNGGMNILGGALLAVVAAVFFFRANPRVKGWVIADGAMLGLLVGHAIGRIGNLINIELYGPPTGSDTFGILVPAENRLAQFPVSAFPVDTRFHPTMLYEAIWLLLVFGVLVWLFYRYQQRFKPGMFVALYLIFSSLGRFFFEFLRPDQPTLERILGQPTTFTFSQVIVLLFLIIGGILMANRMGELRLRIIGIGEPVTNKDRVKYLENIERERRRKVRAREREKLRQERQQARAQKRDEQLGKAPAPSSTSESK